MGLSFKDYVVISDALEAEQLDEDWMSDAILAIKKKLGGKMSDDEIAAEIGKLKDKKAGADKKVAGGAERMAQTQQSRDFNARRADMAAKAAARQPQGTIGTSHQDEHPSIARDRETVANRSARAANAVARRNQYPNGVNSGLEIEGDVLAEAQIEFNVKYRAKGSDGTSKDKKTVIKGTDVRNVKDKFRLQYAGWMFISAEPKNVPRYVAKKKVEEVQEDQDCGPLGPRS
jgi:hypothetical protein